MMREKLEPLKGRFAPRSLERYAPRQGRLRAPLLGLLLLLSACRPPEGPPAAEEMKPYDRGRILLLLQPEGDPREIRQRFEPLRAFLQKVMGQPFHLEVPGNYPEFLERLEKREPDLVYLDALRFLQVTGAGYVPLVMGMHGRTPDSGSLFLVHAQNLAPAQEGAGARAEVSNMSHVKFGSKHLVLALTQESSLSGAVMPLYYLEKVWQKVPGDFASVIYAGSDVGAARKVWLKEADVGVVGRRAFRKLKREHPDMTEQLAVLWETPRYADFFWAYNPYTLLEEKKDHFSRLMLGLEDRKLLAVEGVEAYGAFQAPLLDDPIEAFQRISGARSP